ncbi:MAG: hypothetical protein EOO46_22705 [Flavobacterium sp.]|nr:MAG: hypothetical protein EOO46_22705 [Flavobacterium sp.]
MDFCVFAFELFLFTFLTAIMSELDRIRTRIEATEADLAEAKRVGDRDMILACHTTLAEQQKEKNLLLAQSIPTPGKSPSNKF